MGNIIFQFSSMAAHTIVLVSFYHLAMFFLLQSKLLVNDNGFHQTKKITRAHVFCLRALCQLCKKKKKSDLYIHHTHAELLAP